MRVLSAHFENFRLLRELDLEFSADETKRLTVIRAANETGKTTILTALQWALYGDSALPDKGVGYRLHPIDWDVAKEGNTVPIAVSVDLEVVRYNKIAGTMRASRRRYRVLRTAREEVTKNGGFERISTYVRLMELTTAGAAIIENPEALINDELPPELRDVFFTDGDRALSFIEADVSVSTKRDKVQRAIRALLGLGVIEDALRHVKKTSLEVNKQAQRVGAGSDLARVAERLEVAVGDITRFEAQLADSKAQFAAFDEKIADVEKKIDEALRHGDRDELRKELQAIKSAISKLDERGLAAAKDHSALFRSEALARDLLAPSLSKAFDSLKELHDKGRIPNTTLPVLEERLKLGTCICGESLSAETPDGSTRRAHIEHLIDHSRKSDQTQEIVTRLYYGSRSMEQGASAEPSWLDQYKAVVENRDSLGLLREDEGRKLMARELVLDSLPDTDVASLREIRRQYASQKDRFNSLSGKFEAQLADAERQRDELAQQRERLLREQKKGARVVSDLEVVQDILVVLQRSCDQITEEELHKVSDLMNSLFLEMIGADPKHRALIERAEISAEFDITVFGPSGRRLNPDRDLNGASRRALTLAFILALTKVSEVEAPNVIDTPLGMMSGFVKRSVLRVAIRESTQPILFLTHSEIAGCEEIIDQYAGVIFTLTNPTHYPKMLVNRPSETLAKVLRCPCNHRRTCAVCERKLDAEEPAAEESMA